MAPSSRLRYGLAVGWTVAIVVGCTLPGDAMPDLVVLSEDKLIHLLAFAGFAFLWQRVYPRAVLRIVVWGLLFGLAIEVYQHLMPIGRFFDPFDALADALGLFLGLGAVQARRSASAPSRVEKTARS